MSTAGVVRARIDPRLKEEAMSVLASMGLSVSDLIRLTLVRVAADKAIPFDIRVPNAETATAIRSAEAGNVKTFDTTEALFEYLNNDEE